METSFRAFMLFLVLITGIGSVWLLLHGRPFLEKVCRPWRLLLLVWEASWLAMGWAVISPLNADRVVALALAVQCSVWLYVAWRSYLGETMKFGPPLKVARGIIAFGSCFPLFGLVAGIITPLRGHLLH